jgi:uncharacterized protein YtpQ (UPF0354 family)
MQTKFTDNAIAYLKKVYRDSGTSTEVVIPAEAAPVFKDYSQDFWICYVVDRGNAFEYVQESHLKQDGIDRDKLHRIGLGNLLKWAISHKLRVQPYGSIFAVLMGGNFEASLILIDKLWEDPFKKFVSGEYAAAMPARDILSFCDSSSPAGVDGLKQLIARTAAAKTDHPISDKIYVRRDGMFQPRAVV